MATDRNRIEIERVRNLVTNFGWRSKSEEVTDTDIIMVLVKPRVDMPTGTEGGPSA